MPERDGYIPGVPCWADTSQPDPAAAAEFYGGLFGWAMEDVMPPGSDTPYLIGRIRGGDVAAVSAIPEGAPPMAMWNTYIWVEDADATTARAKDAGGSVITEPFDIGDAGRMAVLADPAGAVFCVWQARDHKGSRVVNEHGAVNFNNLNTTDVEGAKTFYGAVFGWDTIPMGGGAEAWTLSGYGEYLESLNPGWLKGLAEMGAPQGFENVVANLLPITDDTPPHWNITFGVDDADDAAARATELGGKVLVGPMDAPWVRMAVIQDPQGAVFVANQFVPENRNLGAPAGTTAA